MAELVAAGVMDVIPGDPPVPVSVWRANEPGTTTGPAQAWAGLTSRVAAMLIATYTVPGDLVLDATSDPALAGAAGAGARMYLPAPRLSLTTVTRACEGQAALIVLRWPVPEPTPNTWGGSGRWSAAVNRAPGIQGRVGPDAVLGACAQGLCPGGHTVVMLAPPDGGAYADHAHTLIPAARAAGLGYLQHLVVITASPEADLLATGLARAHLDVLVFVLHAPTKA